ncbi:MAG TPA: ABC transporter permease [Cytophagales bacterium]|jgi:lipopolysaccharide transport system permease protein|nr:ABC transporter permease [Cytophagales bacterium]
MKEQEEEWSLVIQPKNSWFNLHLGDIWRYRDLVYMFVRRDFVSQYKQTILGPIWFVLQPLLTTLTYMIIFGRIAKLPTDGLPQAMFYMSGILMWNYFAGCLNKTSDTFVANANIFGKVYFPRLTVPISNVISGLVSFFIQSVMFIGIYVYFFAQGVQLRPNIYLLLLPYLIALMAFLGLGLGIIVSSLTTKYRDLKFLVSFGVQLLMYATPIIYPLSLMSGKYKTYILLNPMTSIVETFRFSVMGVGEFKWEYLGYSSLVTLLTLIFGIILFNKVEKDFMDTV